MCLMGLVYHLIRQATESTVNKNGNLAIIYTKLWNDMNA